MKITKLTLSNIRSYRSEEIVFPEGSILLAGDIGSGKTTILLSIEYALFGLQPGHRGSSLLSNGENEGRVILECTLSDQHVVIERTLKRSSKGVNQEDCWITVDGKRESLSVTELKSRILTLLKYPEEFIKKTNLLYRYTVYSPQEEMKQIILEDPESRLDIIRHIFGIDKYRRIKENVSLVAIKLREQMRFMQGEIKDIEVYKGKILETERLTESAEQKIKELDKKIAEKKNVRKLIESEMAALEEKRKEFIKFEKEIEKANVQLTNKRALVRDQSVEEKRLSVELSSLPTSFDEKEYKSTLDELTKGREQKEALQKEITRLATHISSLLLKKEEDSEKSKRVFSMQFCPTCLQDVSDSHKHNILNETEGRIRTVNKESSDLAVQLNTLRANLDDVSKHVLAIEAKKLDLERQRVRMEMVSSSKKRLEEVQRSQEANQKDISFLIEHLASLKASLLEFSTFDALAKKKDTELKAAFAEEKRAEIEYAEGKKEKEFLTREKKRLTQELAEKEKKKEKTIYISQLESWLTGAFTELIITIERRVMLKVREEFSRLFNKWFSVLTTDAFQVKLDENFSPIILQKEYELDYAFLSGGERTAIALAYRLALNQILNALHSTIQTKGLIVLDEPTDGFSEQQLDKVRDILREIKVDQLIIVSHEPKVEGFVDHVLKVRKENGYSSLE